MFSARRLGLMATALALLPLALALPLAPATQPAPPAGTKKATPVLAVGDRLPAGAVARLGSSKFRVGSPVNSLRYVAQGKMLLAGTLPVDSYQKEGTFALLDAATGQTLRRWKQALQTSDAISRTCASLACRSWWRSIASTPTRWRNSI